MAVATPGGERHLHLIAGLVDVAHPASHEHDKVGELDFLNITNTTVLADGPGRDGGHHPTASCANAVDVVNQAVQVHAEIANVASTLAAVCHVGVVRVVEVVPRAGA